MRCSSCGRPIAGRALSDPDAAAHRLDELRRVEPDALLEHQLDVLDVGDGLRGIALHHDQIGPLARGHRADLPLLAEEARAVPAGDGDRLDRAEPCLDQELHLALIPEPGQNSAVAGGVRPGEQQPSRADERDLEVHLLAEGGFRKAGRAARAAHAGPEDEVALPGNRSHRVEDPGLHRRPIPHQGLEDRERGGDRDLPLDQRADR